MKICFIRAFFSIVLSALGVTEAATLYVSDPAYGKVYSYDSPAARTVFASVYYAEGLAFDSSGNLFVTNFNQSLIYKFSPAGRQTTFSSDPTISNPSALAFDSFGNLFVAHNGFGPGISRIAPEGTVTPFASGIEPSGLAFDSKGNLFATDYISNTILKFLPNGASSTFATGFAQPTGLAFDTSGNLFVSDILAGSIYELTPDGHESIFASGLTQPIGLTFDAKGNLFAAEAGDGGSIEEFAPNGARSTFASGVGVPFYLAFQSVPESTPLACMIFTVGAMLELARRKQRGR